MRYSDSFRTACTVYAAAVFATMLLLVAMKARDREFMGPVAKEESDSPSSAKAKREEAAPLLA